MATSEGPFATLWKEYAFADYRWGVADETVVSLEILTVLGAGPICCLILYQIVKRDPARHYWSVVLCTAELYGGWMTFCPEWLTGSKNLNTTNPLYLWVYLFVSSANPIYCIEKYKLTNYIIVNERHVSMVYFSVIIPANFSSPVGLSYHFG